MPVHCRLCVELIDDDPSPEAALTKISARITDTGQHPKLNDDDDSAQSFLTYTLLLPFERGIALAARSKDIFS